MKKSLLTLLLLSSSVVLTACNNSSNSNNSNNNGNTTNPSPTVETNNIQNPVVGTTVYTSTDFSAVAASSVVMTYKMLGVNGKEVQATSLVFTPKTAPPATGWPIVVWAHETVGVADACAPSRHPIKDSSLNLITKLLKAGYVVVAPDYEGLGDNNQQAHPFLNVKSEGYSITDAVVAARNLLGNKVSNQWLTVGHSQGGHAALGAAQYASRANLNYKGTIAVAPASNLELIFNTGETLVKNLPAILQVDTRVGLNTYAALIVAGMQGQTNPVSFSQVFETESESIAKHATSTCADDLEEEFTIALDAAADEKKSLSGYLTQDKFMKVPTISTFLNTTSQPLTAKVSTPITIYQGLTDTTIPFIATNALVDAAKNNGTKITYVTKESWDHHTAMSENVDNIINDVKTYMPIQ